MPLPPRYKVIGYKWVFGVKLLPYSFLNKLNQGLLLLVFCKEDIDFYKTFYPVVKSSTIDVVLCLTLTFNWSIHQIDVNNVFLNGKEIVYMQQPPSFEVGIGLVYKLKKSFYGLKQTPRLGFKS